ncbi:ABC transporter substrate-binding protein [Sinorhizobium mexicanum]|uniref:ABC transporter substrate-binding protein n=1 Tax=Sinorhizobium mexicanum TaxID=375549 RepID=A0A859QE35_9HYPH|nr:ABC transporter substrate-binding protein [Sinorhizobium mexicanum]MBP1886492.1 nickel transport system substrate-binding protein [Sinorhizobium mexicanum]QLL63933.1 ABC transporter substrate-binding protein [Sinorhizobium mexicanum]
METTRRNLLVGSATLGVLASLASPFGIQAFAADGDTLRIALNKPAGNLDLNKYIAVWAVQAMIFEPLVRYGEGGHIEPALAESWTVSEDGKLLTFKLRQDIKFSDGTPFDADAAKWNFDRWIGKEDSSWLLISAAHEKTEVVDQYTISLHLKQAVPSALPELTTIRPVRFQSPNATNPDGSMKDPVGTGPWAVTKNDATGTELVRNDLYWGQKPSFDKVSLVVMPNARSRLEALRAGLVDIIGGAFVAAISPQEASTLESSGTAVIKELGTDTMVLGFNPDRVIIQDPLVRQAIGLCLDKTAICTKLLRGFATPTSNLFPEVIPNSGKRVPVSGRDVAKAKELLDQAGWKGEGVRQKDGRPLSLELVISEDAVAGSRALGEVIQNQVKEAGIDIQLKLVDHVSRHDDIPQLKYDMALFISAGAPYDPHSSLTTYFLSTYRTGTDGKMFMDAKNLDPLVLAALSASAADAPAAYQAFYDWLEDHHAIVPIYHASRIWAHGERVKNFHIPPTEYEMPHEGISLS